MQAALENDPLVSVVLPVYNRPDVVKTINSILRQTYKNIEMLIIDNASTDETVEKIKGIQDPRIKLMINDENRGQTYSLNRGLLEASGKYIARIDSDDIALPERIEKQVRFLEKNTDYVLVGSWVRFISDDDHLGMIVKMPATNEGLQLMHTVSCGMYHPSAMYRNNTIKENGLLYNRDIGMAEDYDLWVRLMRYGKACNLPEVLTYYRRGDYNDSRHHRDQMEKESREIRKRYCDEIITNTDEKIKVFNIISLEERQQKSIGDCFRIFWFYRSYLKSHIDKKTIDYDILKLHFNIKIYGSCFATNDKRYAKALRKLYKIMRDLKNRKGEKVE